MINPSTFFYTPYFFYKKNLCHEAAGERDLGHGFVGIRMFAESNRQEDDARQWQIMKERAASVWE